MADLFNSFSEEVYAVPFFKVVQQQTVVKWEIQLCVCGEILLSATVKELLKSDSICQSYAQMKKGPVFWLAVYLIFLSNSLPFSELTSMVGLALDMVD